MLADAALHRLVAYTRRATFMPRETVDVEFGDNGRTRGVRFVGAPLRRLVWNDGEVRQALLDFTAGRDDGERGRRMARWNAFSAELERHGANPFALLDLVSAMSLEAERREPERPAA
jgi:hypothetical protein